VHEYGHPLTATVPYEDYGAFDTPPRGTDLNRVRAERVTSLHDAPGYQARSHAAAAVSRYPATN
jgi:hypothetical protein